MSTETSVTVCGNVVADPTHRRTDAGVDVCGFRIASTARYRDRSGQWADGATSWYSVTAWNGLGANCAASLRKGERVVVSGRLRTRDWTTEDGRSGTSVEITAWSVGHDLAWGTTRFSRVVRTVDLEVPGREVADELVDEVEGHGRLRADADGVVVDEPVGV